MASLLNAELGNIKGIKNEITVVKDLSPNLWYILLINYKELLCY